MPISWGLCLMKMAIRGRGIKKIMREKMRYANRQFWKLISNWKKGTKKKELNPIPTVARPLAVPLFFKPVSEDNGNRAEAKAGHSCSYDHAEIKVELTERFDLRAEKEPQPGQDNPRHDDLPGPDAVDKATQDRRAECVDHQGDRLGSSCICPIPFEVVGEGDEEDGERGSKAKPEGQRDHGEADNHPAVVKFHLLK